MGIIARKYQTEFVCRYDKAVGVPYYSADDFKGLKQEKGVFINTSNIETHYFFYYYDNYKTDKLVLFCPGIGPGHTAYLREIEYFAKKGYKVLTLDYAGTGESKGEILNTLNGPTRDVIDLLNLLNIKEPIVLVGHSLGGYTSLNLMALRKDIKKAVVISGFLTVGSLLQTFTNSRFITHFLVRYEKKTLPQYSKIDVLNYLKTTDDDLLFFHSVDDPMVKYSISMKVVEQIDNSHIETVKYLNKKHNPQYTEAALEYMNEVFGKYNRLSASKNITSDEERIAYFKDVSLDRVTELDEKVMGKIIAFIEK